MALAPTLGAGLALTATTACESEPLGIRIDLKVEREELRPQYIKFHWLRPGREPFEARLPESGEFTEAGAVFGSLFVETVGPLSEPRVLVVQGFQGEREISGGVGTIVAGQSQKRHLLLVLGERLLDANGNKIPDVVDQNCLGLGLEGRNCEGMNPPASDAGGPPVSADAGLPDSGAPDTSDAGPEVAAIEQGLIGWWRFDETAGPTAADSSGRGHAGAWRGAELASVPGRIGGGLALPNLGGHGVLVPRSATLDALSSFTIAAFVRRVEATGRIAGILSRRSTGRAEHYALMLAPDGQPRLYLNTHLVPPPTPLTGPAALPEEAWAHVAATYDGRQARLYVDGVEVATAAITTPIAGRDSGLCLGCGQNTETEIGEPLAGHLDDLRLYDRALGPTEIAALAR